MNEERVVKNDTIERERENFRVISDIDIEHTEKRVTCNSFITFLLNFSDNL